MSDQKYQLEPLLFTLRVSFEVRIAHAGSITLSLIATIFLTKKKKKKNPIRFLISPPIEL